MDNYIDYTVYPSSETESGWVLRPELYFNEPRSVEEIRKANPGVIEPILAYYEEKYPGAYVESFFVEPQEERDPLPRAPRRRRRRRRVRCCSGSQCRQLIKLIKEYLVYDIGGAFPPVCAEEGTFNPHTGEPIIDWSSRTAVSAAIGRVTDSGDRRRASGSLLFHTPPGSTVPVPVIPMEFYAGKGVKGLMQAIESAMFVVQKTAISTTRGKMLWCQEIPELETAVLASDITEDRLVELPDTTIYVIVRVDYSPGRIRHLWPSMRPGVPSKLLAGYVLFRDSEGNYSSEYAITGESSRLPLPFPSKHILIRPSVGTIYEIAVKRVVIS
jgi:hypothetical protein